MGSSLVVPCTSGSAKSIENNLIDAATLPSLTVEADNPDCVALLQSATQNPKLHNLEVLGARRMQSDLVCALVDCLVAHSFIESLSFGRSALDLLLKTEIRNDYTALIDSISRSPSLQTITIACDLPLELGEAIMEGLKRREAPITLVLRNSSFITSNAIRFGQLLATGKGLARLHLKGGAQCYDINGKNLRDGIRKSQCLKELWINASMDTIKCILDGLDGNRSLEELVLCGNLDLDSSGTSLLNKRMANHEKLASLHICVTVDAWDDLCEAVSRSRSLKMLGTRPSQSILPLSEMLKRTTSLESLCLTRGLDSMEMELLAVGMKACKTLWSISAFDWTFDIQGTSAFLEAVLVNHSLKQIRPLPALDLCEGEVLSTITKELTFYLAFNNRGRRLVRSNVLPCVWPYALEKAGRSSLPDALYFLLRQTPELVM